MSKHNETTNATVGNVYRVTYTFINKDGFIRGGQITAFATSPETACEEALKKLTSLGVNTPRIGNAKIY